jgi:ABC-type nitrate/sulfonate/bicarbonate transport system permease component
MNRRERIFNVLGVVVVCVIWALFVSPGGVFIPTLSEVASEFVPLAQGGLLLEDIATSVARVLAGVGIAALVVMLLALLAASIEEVGFLLSGPVELLRPIPPLAWVPIAILIFGVGDAPAIAIVALGAFFPLWLGMQQGFSEVRAQHILAARSFGASARIRLTDVIIPSVMPYAFHGLRLGLGLGWFCVVAAEMMGANTGLGYGVQLFSLNLELGRTYVYILAIGVLGAAMNYGMRAIEARLFRWHRLSVQGDE